MRLWTLMHTYPENPCGGPAVKAIRKPLSHDLVTPELMRNIDGSIPLSSDRLVCQSCGEPICQISADDFVEDDYETPIPMG